MKRLKEIPDLWLVLFVLVLALALYVLIFGVWGVWEGTIRDLLLAAATAFFTLLKTRAGRPDQAEGTPTS